MVAERGPSVAERGWASNSSCALGAAGPAWLVTSVEEVCGGEHDEQPGRRQSAAAIARAIGRIKRIGEW